MSASPRAPAAAGRRFVWIKLAIALIGAAVLVWRVSRYWPFIADDALISLRYAKRLVDGDGLTWTDGERVEGYSNLLWVLACGGLHALGMDLVTAARALGLVGHVAVIGAVVRIATLRSMAQVPSLILLVVAFALAGPIAVWAIGGLEPPLLVALLAWAVVGCVRAVEDGPAPRAMIMPGVLLGLVCLTRPDGIVLGAGLCAGVALAGGLSRRSLAAAVMLAVPQLVAVAGQLIFRRLYYDDWVPNTAYAKVAFTAARVAVGLDYVVGSLRPLLGIWLPAVVGVVAAVRDAVARRRVLVIAVPLVLWLGYVVVIGGDFFPARRHLVPAIALAVMLAVEGFAWLASRGRVPLLVGSIAMAGLLADLAVKQSRDRENAKARHERWEWDGAEVGKLLKQAFTPQQPLVAVDPAGCIPYFSELPSLDMMGLNDRYLARHRPAGFGSGMLGHELGDGHYVLSRRPDLVVFCDATGKDVGCFPSGIEMSADPSFHAQYRMITFETPGTPSVRARIWARLDGRIGIAQGPAELRIPGWLFTGDQTIARLGGGGIAAEVPAGHTAELSQLPVEAGAWRVHVEAEPGEASIRIRDASGALHEGSGTWKFLLPAGHVSIELGAHDTPCRITSVVLTRAAD